MPRTDEASRFIELLAKIEASLPVKSILFEPFLQDQTSGKVIRFRLANTGNRDAEIIEVEVCVPRSVTFPGWQPPQIPNILSTDGRQLGGENFLVIREQPFEGAQDVMRYGSHKVLPRIVSPHWTPRLSDLLKIPIRPDLTDPHISFVEYKVVARGLYVEPGRARLTEIPILP
jgi:hypothetical protein